MEDHTSGELAAITGAESQLRRRDSAWAGPGQPLLQICRRTTITTLCSLVNICAPAVNKNIELSLSHEWAPMMASQCNLGRD